jgi:hypothetical protein
MATVHAPILTKWTGGAFVPLNPAWATRADRAYAVDAEYMVEATEPRSERSHNHFFATVHESWMNLPENIAEHFPNETRLRKWCLIKAGYRNERTYPCETQAEAERLAAFIKPMDDYAVVMARDGTVTVYTAESQSKAAMGGKRFQESKTAVLDELARLTGTDVDTLKKNAGQAA